MLRLRSVGKKLTEVTADDFKNVVKGEAKTINVMGVDFPTVVLEDGKQLLISPDGGFAEVVDGKMLNKWGYIYVCDTATDTNLYTLGYFPIITVPKVRKPRTKKSDKAEA